MKPAYRKWLRWLTVAALIAGVISTFSYGSGAHLIVRYLDPPVGRWWNEHEFALMIFAAAALGMLIAVRIGARLLDDTAARARAAVVSMIAGAVVLIPIARLGAALGQLGWTGANSFDTYAMNSIVDKLLIAGVYFLKVFFFGLIAGLAIFAVVAMAVALATPAPSEARQ
ncbi:MAG TPA: hypothetical protein VMV13_02830 [Candidatus Binataceae bacterium]|nr:hypothetical protein [Candidatus Binataceae bacterium]